MAPMPEQSNQAEPHVRCHCYAGPVLMCSALVWHVQHVHVGPREIETYVLPCPGFYIDTILYIETILYPAP